MNLSKLFSVLYSEFINDNDFLMTVCTYDDVNVLCTRSDGYVTAVLQNFNVILKKEANQWVAVKTLPR